jgi:hypothetical protein
MDLRVCTDEINFQDIAATFTKVAGKKGVHRYVPFDQFFPLVEPFPDAPANWAAGPNAPRDESSMTYRQNFTAWWKFWGEGMALPRDLELLDRVHPKRIKSLEEWMRTVQYDGKRRSILKGLEDLERHA